MTYTYDPAAIMTSARDWARWRLADNVGSKRSILDDAEIDAVVAAYTPITEGVAQLALKMAAEYTRRAEETQDGDARTRYGHRGDFYTTLAERIRREIPPPALAGTAQPKSVTYGDLARPDMTTFIDLK